MITLSQTVQWTLKPALPFLSFSTTSVPLGMVFFARVQYSPCPYLQLSPLVLSGSSDKHWWNNVFLASYILFLFYTRLFFISFSRNNDHAILSQWKEVKAIFLFLLVNSLIVYDFNAKGNVSFYQNASFKHKGSLFWNRNSY